MEIWQGIGLMIPILLASRFAVRSRLRREAADDFHAFNQEWQESQRRFTDANRLT